MRCMLLFYRKNRLQITSQKENGSSQASAVFSLKMHKVKTALAYDLYTVDKKT